MNTSNNRMRRSALVALLSLLPAVQAHGAGPDARLLPQALRVAGPTYVLEPRLRPLSWSLLGSAVIAAGVGGFFALQSDQERATLDATLSQTPISSITQAKAYATYAQATRNAQVAVAVLGGAAALGALGAGFWWYGNKIAVLAAPSGVAVSGVFQ